MTASCDKPCHAILDTGASRCIIGEKVLQQLRQHLPPEIDSQVKQVPSSVTFRFGNNQSLTSSYRIQIPLLRQDNTPRKLWLAIEVVPGSTPFLFSKKAFKQLGGILDTTKDQCIMQRLNRVFSLEHSKTDLYLLDITKLCSPENSSSEVFHAHHVGSVKASWGNKDVITGKEHDKCVVKSPQSPFHFPRVSDSTTFNFRKFVSSRGKFVPESSHVDSSTRNASKPDVDKSEERFRVHDRTTDSVASDLGSSIGVPAIYRRQRGAPELRGHTDHEQHASGASESETGTPKFGGQSNVPRCGKTSGSTTCSINGSPGSLCYNSESNSSGNFKCQSISFERNTGQSSSPRHAIGCAWQPRSFVLDSGRGRGGDQRDVDPRGGKDSSSSKQSSSPSITSIDSSDSGRLGNHRDYMGQEAQRQVLSASVPSGHRILPLVIGKVPEFATQSTRLCSLLSSAIGAGSPGLSGNSDDACSSSVPTAVIDTDFHEEVQRTRNQLNANFPSFVRDQDLSHSYVAAEGLIEQVFHSAKSSCPKIQIKLLEVYAGPHSPLVEAVQSLGYQAMRFTKTDGDLSTLSGRRKLGEIIDRFQPENIWVAPECRPWGDGLDLISSKVSSCLIKSPKIKMNSSSA